LEKPFGLNEKPKEEAYTCLKKSTRNLKKNEMDKLRKKHGREAIKEERASKEKQK
jgi:hypothetical protein